MILGLTPSNAFSGQKGFLFLFIYSIGMLLVLNVF